jgi:hypothetical protein
LSFSLATEAVVTARKDLVTGLRHKSDTIGLSADLPEGRFHRWRRHGEFGEAIAAFLGSLEVLVLSACLT